jgi:hypothetical protein
VSKKYELKPGIEWLAAALSFLSFAMALRTGDFAGRQL